MEQQGCPDNAETQLPCEASELPSTDVAARTLQNLDDHHVRIAEEAKASKVWIKIVFQTGFI